MLAYAAIPSDPPPRSRLVKKALSSAELTRLGKRLGVRDLDTLARWCSGEEYCPGDFAGRIREITKGRVDPQSAYEELAAAEGQRRQPEPIGEDFLWEGPPPEDPPKPPGKKMGRPIKHRTPLAMWILQHREGDRRIFAEEVGISKGHLDQVLSRKAILGSDVALKIKDITSLSLDEIILKPTED
jgi:hypothetical protein